MLDAMLCLRFEDAMLYISVDCRGWQSRGMERFRRVMRRVATVSRMCALTKCLITAS